MRLFDTWGLWVQFWTAMAYVYVHFCKTVQIEIFCQFRKAEKQRKNTAKTQLANFHEGIGKGNEVQLPKKKHQQIRNSR